MYTVAARLKYDIQQIIVPTERRYTKVGIRFSDPACRRVAIGLFLLIFESDSEDSRHLPLPPYKQVTVPY